MSEHKEKRSYGTTDNNISNNILTVNHVLTDPRDIINVSCCRCSFIIEPLVFLFNFASHIIDICYSQFLYKRVFDRLLYQNLNHQNSNITLNHVSYDYFLISNNATCFDNENKNKQNSTNLDSFILKAQQEAAHINFISAFFSGVPIIFTILLFGVNCSTIGRKPIFIWVIFIIIIKNIIYLQLSFYPELPDYIIYISALIDGLGGSNSLFDLVMFCYIADITSNKERSFRMTLVSHIGLIFNALMSYFSGYIIEYYGYKHLFTISLSFYVIAIIYAIVFVPETSAELRKKSIIERLKLFSLFRIFNILKFVLRNNDSKIIFKNKEITTKEQSDEETEQNRNNCENQALLNNNLKRRQISVIRLVIVANMIYCFGTAGVTSIFNLFVMNTPFCWNSISISTFSLYTSIGLFLFPLLFSKVLSDCLKVNDVVVCIISVISMLIGTSFYGLSKNNTYIYIGRTISIIAGLEFAYARSLTTKPYEETDTLTIITFVDVISVSASKIVFNYLYGYLVSYFPNLIFFIIAIVFAIVLFIYICTLFIYEPNSNEAQN